MLIISINKLQQPKYSVKKTFDKKSILFLFPASAEGWDKISLKWTSHQHPSARARCVSFRERRERDQSVLNVVWMKALTSTTFLPLAFPFSSIASVAIARVWTVNGSLSLFVLHYELTDDERKSGTDEPSANHCRRFTSQHTVVKLPSQTLLTLMRLSLYCRFSGSLVL